MEDYQEGPSKDKSIKGYQIVIVILAVVLGALSFMYFRQVQTLKADFSVERDTLTNQLSAVIMQMDGLKTENDTINVQLAVEREKADSILQKLQKERSFSAAKIRGYEKELGTMRTIMRGFVHQIDSLNTLNRKLVDENLDFRRQVTTQRQRAELAEEQASELNTKVRRGSVIRVRDISLVTLSGSDKEVSRASRASRVRVDFVLTANELANPGERNIYMRLTAPDGYIMANSSGSVFDFEGDKLAYSAMRGIDYQNQDLSVSIYYNGEGITAGTYKVALYMDGYRIGTADVLVR